MLTLAQAADMTGALAAYKLALAEVLSRYKGAGEALAQMGLCGGPAASLLKVSSVKKH